MTAYTCLVVNVGNTRSAAALMVGRHRFRVARILTRGATARLIDRTIRRVMKGRSIDAAVLGSVVPSANRLWIRTIRRATGVCPLIVSPRLRLGYRLDYPRPHTLGADRLANVSAVAGDGSGAAIVVDFGTAAAFNVLTEDGRLVGGAIAPGPALMTECLAERTALLPKVRPAGPIGRVGRSTAGAIRLAVQVGYPGMVQAITMHLVRRLRLRRVRLVATGGQARWVIAGLDLPFIVDPNLTFRGLQRIAELNRRP